MAKTKVVLLRHSADLSAGENLIVIDSPDGYVIISGGYDLVLNGNTADVLTTGVFANQNPVTATRYIFKCVLTLDSGASASVGLLVVAARGKVLAPVITVPAAP